jgi:hypothetical protein
MGKGITMAGRWTALPAALALLAAGPPPPAFTTGAPLDTVQACITSVLAENGQATAINTASGVTLDLGFANVAANGRVTTSHISVSIDDKGTQRRVTAAAADGADAVLAQQIMREAVRRCVPDAEGR